jgi:hypothetical protein
VCVAPKIIILPFCNKGNQRELKNCGAFVIAALISQNHPTFSIALLAALYEKGSSMFYQILVNGKSIGTFGHEKVLNFHAGISAGLDEDGKQWVFIKPSCVCEEDGKQYLIDWPFYHPKLDDNIQVSLTTGESVNKSERKYEMKRR